MKADPEEGITIALLFSSAWMNPPRNPLARRVRFV